MVKDTCLPPPPPFSEAAEYAVNKWTHCTCCMQKYQSLIQSSLQKAPFHRDKKQASNYADLSICYHMTLLQTIHCNNTMLHMPKHYSTP